MTDVPEGKINPNDLRQVIAYIGKMKDYDRSNFIKLQQVNELIWGIFFISGGVLDFVFQTIGRPDLSAIPWAISSVSGMFISIFINTRKSREVITPEMEKASQQMASMYKTNVVLTTVAWLLMFAFVILTQLFFLIMPIVSFLIGTTVIGYNIRFRDPQTNVPVVKFKNFYKPSNRVTFIAFFCYLSTFVNIVSYFISPGYIVFIGLTTGIFLGIAFGSGAFVDR